MSEVEELSIRRALKAAIDSGNEAVELQMRRRLQALSATPATPEPSPITGQDVARSVRSGALLDFGDEAQGAAVAGMEGYAEAVDADPLPAWASVFPPVHALRLMRGADLAPQETYDRVRDFERAEQHRFGVEHPTADVLGKIGGGILGGAAAGAAAPVRALGEAVRGLNFAQRLGVAGLTGGTLGGAAGYGGSDAPTLEEAAPEIAQGAGMGMVAGPVAETIGTAAQALMRPMSPERSAERSLRRAVRRGDDSIEDIQARLREMGPDAVLADVNDGLRGELERVVNMPGTARTRAIEQLTNRSEKQFDEILRATGPGNYYENLAEMNVMRQRMASPLYRSAFEKRLADGQGSELDELFKTFNDILPDLWGDAKKLGRLDAAADGIDLDPAMLTDGIKPSFRGWQAIKEQLDDEIQIAYRAGSKAKGNNLHKLQRRLLKELDRQSPEFRAARKIWAGTKAFDTAMDEGMAFMRPSMNVSKLRDHIRNMNSRVERRGFREGARQSIQNLLESKGDTHDLTKFFRNPAMREKVRMVFGTEASGIMKTVEASSAKHKTFAETLGNSATARRQAQRAEEGAFADTMEAVGEGLMAFNTGGMTSPTLLRRAMRSVPTSRESTRNQIADVLLETDPAKQAEMLEWILSGRPMPTTGAGLLVPAVAGGSVGLLASE